MPGHNTAVAFCC